MNFDSPLIRHRYTADPSAHVFNDRIYLYPSHDIDHPDAVVDDTGDQYAMRDYHVFSMDAVGAEVIDHGVALALEDIPWASKQLWAPDAAEKNGRYYFYFPARDKDGVFRIGVATSDKPEGPFRPEPEPIAGSFSIDPCSFVDSDGEAFLYFGGLWGGQLEQWQTGHYDPDGKEPEGQQRALGPQVARLKNNMLELAEDPREISILAPDGTPLQGGDHDRRFFEGAWVHRHADTYYLSYSTGDTHYLVYATSKSPYGPFTYLGKILDPVEGWTTHHSIVQHNSQWWLFHHDASLSGKDHLRCVKVKPLQMDATGKIQLVEPC